MANVLAAAAIAVMSCVPLAAQAIPHLERKGPATQLIVDGKPFLMLGGELHNSSASSLEYMQPIWPRLAKLNLNTVLATVSWELLEPEEGRFDYALVDGLVREARRNNLKLVFLWFGSWKNGVSTYVPEWVKADLRRFPRARDAQGRALDVISTFSADARQADGRAFAAVMRHIQEIDGRDHTVLMIQVENEVGLLGTARDHSPAAQAAWANPVPAELISYLEKNRAGLIPELASVWAAAGFKTSGTWPEVFGTGPRADEVFTAWQYARYIGGIAREGKTLYPLPMYVNAWLVQFDRQTPGQYPSGGPVSRMMDVWRAGAPAIDLFAPDIYLSDFKSVCASYARSGNPLFIPEARNDPEAGANAFYAIGQNNALGFSPFAIDDLKDDDRLGRAYDVLRQLAPVLAESAGKTVGILQSPEETEPVRMGTHELRVRFDRSWSDPKGDDSRGFGLIIATGPDEFIAAGSGFQVTFSPAEGGHAVTRIASVDEGRYVDGKWTPGRRMNGDETNGGTGLIFPRGQILIQRIRVYRHE